MKHLVKAGTTDYTAIVKLIRNSSTTGASLTGLTYADVDFSYTRVETDNDVTNGTATATALAALTDAHKDWGFLKVNDTEAPGLYRLDLADAVLAAGAWSSVVTVRGMYATTVALQSDLEFQLVTFDPFDTVRLGLTALPNAAADAAGGLPISDAGGLDLDMINTTAYATKTNTSTIITTCDAIKTVASATKTNTDTLITTANAIHTHAHTIETNCDAIKTIGAATRTNTTTIITTCDAIHTHAHTIETNCDAIKTNTATLITNCDAIKTNTATLITNCDAIKTNTATLITTANAIHTHTETIETNCDAIHTHAAAVDTLTAAAGDGDLAVIKTTALAILTDTGTTLDAAISAINVKTTNLPTSPAAVLSAMTLVSASITAGVFAAGAINADALATDSIDADALAADALAEIKTQAVAALTDIHLDHIFAVAYDPAAQPGSATALLNVLVENDTGVPRFTVNSLENAPSGTGASAASIADAVWDELIADHNTTDGTMGYALNSASAAGDPWGIEIPGSYATTEAGYIVGTFLDIALSTVNTVANAIHTHVQTIETNCDAIKTNTDTLITTANAIHTHTESTETVAYATRTLATSIDTLTKAAGDGDLAVLKTTCLAILTDTGTTLDGKIDTISTVAYATRTNAKAVDDLTKAGGGGDLAVLKTTALAILTDTETTLDGLIDTITTTCDAIHTHVQTIETTCDAILTDTGTTLDGKINTIDTLLDTLTTVCDAILTDTSATLDDKIDGLITTCDAILTDTGTTLDGKINTIDTLLDTLTTVCDAILTDTGTTLDGKIDIISTVAYATRTNTNTLITTSNAIYTGVIVNADGADVATDVSAMRAVVDNATTAAEAVDTLTKAGGAGDLAVLKTTCLAILTDTETTLDDKSDTLITTCLAILTHADLIEDVLINQMVVTEADGSTTIYADDSATPLLTCTLTSTLGRTTRTRLA